MGQAIPNKHPAVVLRSQYRQLRALLAVAMVAVVGLASAVVILAVDDDGTAGLGSTQVVAPGSADAIRSDGGPEESAVAASLGPQPAAIRPDESRIGAAIGLGSGDSTPTGGPDESAVASAISGR